MTCKNSLICSTLLKKSLIQPWISIDSRFDNDNPLMLWPILLFLNKQKVKISRDILIERDIKWNPIKLYKWLKGLAAGKIVLANRLLIKVSLRMSFCKWSIKYKKSLIDKFQRWLNQTCIIWRGTTSMSRPHLMMPMINNYKKNHLFRNCKQIRNQSKFLSKIFKQEIKT